jgi:hypothetical protein
MLLADFKENLTLLWFKKMFFKTSISGRIHFQIFNMAKQFLACSCTESNLQEFAWILLLAYTVCIANVLLTFALKKELSILS